MDYLYSSLDPAIDRWCYAAAVILALGAGIVANLFRLKKKLTWSQCIGICLVIAYVFLVFASTVLSRPTYATHLYELQPFWSYERIWNGDKSLFWEDILNVVLLIPEGMFLSMALRIADLKNRYAAMTVIWFSFLTTVCIEGSQLIFRKGLFEFDDIFHNTLGGLLGCLIYLAVHKIWVICAGHKQ